VRDEPKSTKRYDRNLLLTQSLHQLKKSGHHQQLRKQKWLSNGFDLWHEKQRSYSV